MNSRKIYALLAFICLIICILIAAFLTNYKLIRGFCGDIVVTILIYYFIKSFIKIKPIRLGILVLIFSYTIEIMQYFHLVNLLGLGGNKIARIVIGSTFDFSDLMAYTIGIAMAILVDIKLIMIKVKQN